MSERDATVTGTTVLAGWRMVPRKRKGFFRTLAEQRFLFFKSMPFAVMVLIFNYVPIWGWTAAFQKYKPGNLFSFIVTGADLWKELGWNAIIIGQ